MILKEEPSRLTNLLKMVYSKKDLHNLKDNDSINSWEEGFMQGYLSDDEK